MSGETKKYLDGDGLSVLWTKVKAGDNAVAAGAAEDLQSAVTTINTSIGAINTRLNGGDPVYAAVRDGSGNTITETYIPNSNKGVANGVATLDSNGKVPSTQLPSYVDDVIEAYYYNGSFYEEDTHTTLITPETGKIYVDLSTNKQYRWGGSAYAEISASLAIGTTSGTAFEGSRGYAIEQNYVEKIKTVNDVTSEIYRTSPAGILRFDSRGSNRRNVFDIHPYNVNNEIYATYSPVASGELSMTKTVLKCSGGTEVPYINLSVYSFYEGGSAQGVSKSLKLTSTSVTIDDSKIVTESDTLTENEINAICV